MHNQEGYGAPAGYAQGTAILGVRNDALSDRTGADATYTAVAVDSKGRLLIGAGGGTGTGVVIGQVGGSMATVAVTLTRPADTTAYTAKDAVSNSTSAPTVLTFADLARVNGGGGYIVKARLMTNQSTNTARYRLHLFHTAPTAINDNAAYTLLWANRDKRFGYIDLPACATEGSGSDAAESINDTVRHPIICASASRTVYGMLEALDAFTPASAQVFYIELTADQN